MILIKINSKALFLILISAILLCIIIIINYHIDNTVLKRDYSLLSQKYSALENRFNQSQKTNLDTVISEYVKDKVMPKHQQFDFICEAHKILGMDKINDEIFLYLYLHYQGYSGIKPKTGASKPILMIIKKEGNEYSVISHKNTGNGAYYGPSIKAMFPEKYADKAINAQSNGITKELSNEVIRQENKWFEMLNSNIEMRRNLIDPIKLIEDYFMFYNDKNREGLLSTLTPIKARRYFGFEYLVYKRLVDIQNEKNDRLLEDFLNGRGKVNNIKPNNVKFYIVSYEAKFSRDDVGLEKSGKHTRRFILVRKNETSNWLIDGISYDLMK